MRITPQRSMYKPHFVAQNKTTEILTSAFTNAGFTFCHAMSQGMCYDNIVVRQATPVLSKILLNKMKAKNSSPRIPIGSLFAFATSLTDPCTDASVAADAPRPPHACTMAMPLRAVTTRAYNINLKPKTISTLRPKFVRPYGHFRPAAEIALSQTESSKTQSMSQVSLHHSFTKSPSSSTVRSFSRFDLATTT